MTEPRLKRLSTILLAAYLACFVLAEFVHGHNPSIVIPQEASVSTHTCGAVEVHRPLDWVSHCALCRDGHGRSLAVDHASAQDRLSISPVNVPFPFNQHPPTDARTSAGVTRGPPAI